MRVTRVSVGECKKEDSKILGMATVTLDNSLVLSGFKIMDSKKGLFVSNPSYKGTDGEFHDIFFIMNKKDREFIHKLILDKYIQKFDSTMVGDVESLMVEDNKEAEEELQRVQDGDIPF